jgi:hypothetical protein
LTRLGAWIASPPASWAAGDGHRRRTPWLVTRAGRTTRGHAQGGTIWDPRKRCVFARCSTGW